MCILSLYILFAKDCQLSCISFLHCSRFHYFQHLDTKTTILRRRLRRQPVTAAGEAASLIFTVPAFHTHMTQVIITTRLFFGPYVTTPFKPCFYTIWTAPCKNVSSGICGQRRPRSAFASAQSDLNLHCQLTESLDTTEYMNGEQRPGWYFAHAQGDLKVHVAHFRRHLKKGSLHATFFHIGHVKRKSGFVHAQNRRFRSSCACAKYP